MNALQAAFLGLIQGLTEFLPVSSSGHLVLVPALLGLPAPGLSFSVMVHVGTAFATLVMLRGEVAWLLKSLLARGARGARERAFAVLGCLILASVPGAILGVFGRDLIDRAFSSGGVAALGLIVTGFVLRASGRAPESRSPGERKRRAEKDEVLGTITLERSITIGIAQAVAVMPGISRSGSTITAGLLVGLSREDAVRFSFLISVPATLGAAFLEYRKLSTAGMPIVSGQGLLGAGIAFVAGLFALNVVFRVVRKGELSKFAYYCWAAGAGALVWLLVRG